MPEAMTTMIPEQWQHFLQFLAGPLSWIPGVQKLLLTFVLTSGTGWVAGTYYVLLLFPVLLWLTGTWCTFLSIYTLPFRSGRVDFIRMLLMAWWDGLLAVWMFWVGLAKFVVVLLGWIFETLRLAVRLVAEMGKQLLNVPFSMGSQMTRSYFQPGVPWIAFVLLVGWCLLEGTIFTYTLFPTVSEVLAGIVGVAASPMTGPLLFLFLFFLIMGSFACLQVLGEAIAGKQIKAIIQMVIIELFVMIFEVMFLYRELVDAITPWIAQQTGEQFRLGIGFTLTVATFGWIGIRGMTWFLFGRYGTPALIAVLSRETITQDEPLSASQMPVTQPGLFRDAMAALKSETAWFKQEARYVFELLSLPILQLFAAAVNFTVVLVRSRPIFQLPFTELDEVLAATPFASRSDDGGGRRRAKSAQPASAGGAM